MHGNFIYLPPHCHHFVYNSARLELITVPHVHTNEHEYATLEAYYNRSHYARTLPPVPKDCLTPFGVAGNALLVIIMYLTGVVLMLNYYII